MQKLHKNLEAIFFYERADLIPGTDVDFEIEAGVVRLVKAADDGSSQSRGDRLTNSLGGHGDFKMSTDETILLMRGPPANEG